MRFAGVSQHFAILPSRVETAIGVGLDLVLTSFFKQELARFSNDQRFVYYEHVVVSVMQFDDSRVLHARAEALDCAFYPFRERLDVAIKLLLLGRVQIPVVGQTILRCDFVENAERRRLDTVVVSRL